MTVSLLQFCENKNILPYRESNRPYLRKDKLFVKYLIPTHPCLSFDKKNQIVMNLIFFLAYCCLRNLSLK